MKPGVPMVLGSGPLADECRRMIAADPDRYRATTISTHPIGRCPCCGKNVYRVKSRLTNFEYGFATGTEDDAVVHPVCNPDGYEVKLEDIPRLSGGDLDLTGLGAGGCIPLDRQAEWKEQPKKKAPKKTKRGGR